MKLNLIFLVLLQVLIGGCENPSYMPKPRTYPKIKFPKKEYQAFNESYCPFQFSFPTYAIIEKDTSFFDEKPVNECWYNINFNSLNGKIYCTYYPISNLTELEKNIKDSYKLASQHQEKANYIDELPIRKPNHVSGIVFDIQGPAACPFQFFLTDSTHHFLRGALYFNTKTKPDSLAPFYNFLKTDIMELINTFEWKATK